MIPAAASDSSGGRQLPTRVSNACERCRRNKSRCDPFRPCSLCTRANVECLAGSTEAPSRPAKRKRTRGPSYNEAPASHDAEERSYGTPQATQHQETTNDRGENALRPPIDASRDAESRRPSVAEDQVDSAMSIAQKIYQLSGQDNPILRRTTSAIPGGDVYGRQTAPRRDRAQRQPISSLIGYSLPATDTMRLLLEEYFDAVHWFSLVIYEPRFRPKFESVMDGMAFASQKSFLLLLSVVLGMGAWYKSHKSIRFTDGQNEDWRAWALSLVEGVGSQLTELMDQVSIASVQASILLGSYYLYHGKPNLSFALLGATIRTAQTIGLHREPTRGDHATTEERKRVWWTIYTWDRFASVTYGRPLGINDRDCNVTAPNDTYESPYFVTAASGEQATKICYSSYQRELNKLYMAASPVIETIFSMRALKIEDRIAGQQYLNKVIEATEGLWAWRRRLPSHLLLDLSSDCEPNYSKTSKAHRLQALALQLTFDNLLIIFHRPSLAQQVEQLIRNRPEHGQSSSPSPSLLQQSASSASPHFGTNAYSPLSASQVSSTEQWWEAALRTSKVTQMPQLAQLATDSHLVAFMAINLFNSAIVMAVLAFSDPLSDRAQEVKRSITKIFRLQELLGKKTELSTQSNAVLKDVTRMLLQREADAMLQPVFSGDSNTNSDNSLTQTLSGAPVMSVEDTLRLPIQLPINNINNKRARRGHGSAENTQRLHESLASLQRVFPSIAEAPQINTTSHNEYSEQGHNISDQVPDEDNDVWFNSSLQEFNDEPSWTDATSGVNGLYWFWDSTWGENC